MPAPNPAVLSDVLPRVISILNANPGGFATTVSGDVGAFPTDDEIEAACLEADEMIVTQGYFQSINKTLTAGFEGNSSPLTFGDDIPFMHGGPSRVDLSRVVLNLTQASINIGTDIFTSVAHGLQTGDLISFRLLSGAFPTASPVVVDTADYYAIRLTADTFAAATSRANASAGTAVDFTANPTGSFQIIAWRTGIRARSADDIIAAEAVTESYVESGAFDHLWGEEDGKLYLTAGYARVIYPSYTRTALLQVSKNETSLVVATAIRLLVKNASPAPFETWIGESVRGIRQIVQDGAYSAAAGGEA